MSKSWPDSEWELCEEKVEGLFQAIRSLDTAIKEANSKYHPQVTELLQIKASGILSAAEKIHSAQTSEGLNSGLADLRSEASKPI